MIGARGGDDRRIGPHLGDLVYGLAAEASRSPAITSDARGSATQQSDLVVHGAGPLSPAGLEVKLPAGRAHLSDPPALGGHHLDELVEHVAEAVGRFRAGEQDAFAVDEVSISTTPRAAHGDQPQVRTCVRGLVRPRSRAFRNLPRVVAWKGQRRMGNRHAAVARPVIATCRRYHEQPGGDRGACQRREREPPTGRQGRRPSTAASNAHADLRGHTIFLGTRQGGSISTDRPRLCVGWRSRRRIPGASTRHYA